MPITRIRRALLLLFVVGSLGAEAELLLLKHWGDIWQWVPLVLLVAGAAAILWNQNRGTPRSFAVFQGGMWLYLVSGIVGVVLHYKGNAEWQLETYPYLKGFALLKEGLLGKAAPLLAPGTMILLGSLGLLWTMTQPISRESTHA